MHSQTCLSVAFSLNDMEVIELTAADALLFLQFQKRHSFMQLMEDMGVFSIKSGSVEIHFTSTGEVGSIDIHTHTKIPLASLRT